MSGTNNFLGMARLGKGGAGRFITFGLGGPFYSNGPLWPSSSRSNKMESRTELPIM